MALLYLLLRELRSNVELLSNSVPLTSLFLKGRKVTVSVIILTLSGNHTNGPLISRDVEKRRGGRRIEIRPPLHRVCRPLALGEAFSLGCKLYITFVIVTQFPPNILRNAIPPRCRSDVFGHSPCSWATTGQSSLMQKSILMKNEKLKSTTVRFTDSDLHLIDCLQEKLGLGMIHIIRLAIRRLAENENLLPSNSALNKR
jgi:hypothetical protein